MFTANEKIIQNGGDCEAGDENSRHNSPAFIAVAVHTGWDDDGGRVHQNDDDTN